MRRIAMWALTLCVVAQFGWCASALPVEAQAQARPQPKQQSKPQTARSARLYFLREKSLLGTGVGIKINGQQVGSVAKGTYFSVDRPPGRYRITCVNPLSMDYESEIQIEAGRSYYFGIGTPRSGHPIRHVINQALAGSHGQAMQSTSPLASGFSAAGFYQIDAAEGAAIVRQLTPQ